MAAMPKVTLFLLSLGLAGCGDAPRTNPFEGEAAPLVPSVADPAAALTFAQIRTPAGQAATILVTGVAGEMVEDVELTGYGAPPGADIFDAMSAVGDDGLRRALAGTQGRVTHAVAELMTPAGRGERHVATGTNFREHAKEAKIGEVFNFPKFGPATPARTTVAMRPGELLDYEVEICARFDRDIRTVADFDAARKGFFLCGDFTDRARLMRSVDPANIASGRGFSDAKSGRHYFPTGPFLVVPRDWRAFVRSERMMTQVNREVRQDSRGEGMILDFRAIVEKALTNGGGGRYNYKGRRIPLVPGGTIARGSAVMSGTSEGVIFMSPTLRDLASGGVRYIFTGPMLRGKSAQRTMVEAFVEKELASGRYLQPGDLVTHRSSSMGDVQIRVTSARLAAAK